MSPTSHETRSERVSLHVLSALVRFVSVSFSVLQQYQFACLVFSCHGLYCIHNNLARVTFTSKYTLKSNIYMTFRLWIWYITI